MSGTGLRPEDDGRYLGAAVVALALALLGGWAIAPTAQGALYPTGTDTPATSYLAAAATTNATSVKTSAGNVYGYSLSNTLGTVYYLRMYNLAAAPTCSSAVGFVESIMIPSSTSGAGRERHQPNGQAFSTGIAYCITDTAASTGNGAAAVGVQVTLLFK